MGKGAPSSLGQLSQFAGCPSRETKKTMKIKKKGGAHTSVVPGAPSTPPPPAPHLPKRPPPQLFSAAQRALNGGRPSKKLRPPEKREILC